MGLRAVLPIRNIFPLLSLSKLGRQGFDFEPSFLNVRHFDFDLPHYQDPGCSYAIVGTAVRSIIPATVFHVLLSLFLLLLTDA